MKVKLVFFGEAANIPATDIGLGIAFLTVWIDGDGFTAASNNLGSLGYIFLETPDTEIGEIDAERLDIFSHLHGRTVQWDIKPNLFVRNGGIARIGMSVLVQQDGGIIEKKIEFMATDCMGVSVVSNAVNFSCEMLQMEKKLADLDVDQIIPDDAVVAAIDAAPPPEEEGVA